MGCPDDEALAALLEGRLPPAAAEVVRLHLDDCDSCSSTVVGATPKGAEVPRLPEPGDRLGRYVLLEVVGVGTMGAVFAAYDSQLDRKIALKILRPDLPLVTAELTRQVLSEGRALARLHHPGIVQIFDAEQQDGWACLAMEFVEGPTLRRWLVEGPRTRQQVLVLFRQLADALAAAHEAGLVHRDFKPENVLVRPGGSPCIVDFGFAREGGQRGGSGTLAYMAPEQTRGEPVTAAADQYAFCVAMVEALAGSRPSSARTLPGGWPFAALARGLSSAPADRAPSMRVLARAIARSPAQRALRGLAGLGLAAALGFGAWGAWATSRIAPAACQAQTAAANTVWSTTSREALRTSFAAGGDEGLARFAVVDAVFSRVRDEWTQRWAQACQQAVDRGAGTSPQNNPTLLCLDRRLRELGALGQALQQSAPGIHQGAIGATSKLKPLSDCDLVDGPAAAVTWNGPLEEELARLTALAALGLGDREAQLARFPPLEEAARQAGNLSAQARLLSQRADLTAESDAAAAEALLLEAVQLADAAGDDEARLGAWSRMVNLYVNDTGDRAKAEQAYQQGRAIARRLGRSTSGGRLLASRYANVLMASAQYAEARAVVAQAVEDKRASLAQRPPDAELSSLLGILGVAQLELNELDEARETLTQALDILKANGASLQVYSSRVLSNLSMVEARAGHRALAEQLQLDALAGMKRSVGRETGTYAQALANRAAQLVEQDRCAEASPVAREALSICEAIGQSNSIRAGFARLLLAQCAMAAGQHSEVRALLEAGMPALEAGLGERHAIPGMGHNLRAQLAAREGNWKLARAEIQLALSGVATRGPSVELADCAVLGAEIERDGRGGCAAVRSYALKAREHEALWTPALRARAGALDAWLAHACEGR